MASSAELFVQPQILIGRVNSLFPRSHEGLGQYLLLRDLTHLRIWDSLGSLNCVSGLPEPRILVDRSAQKTAVRVIESDYCMSAETANIVASRGSGYPKHELLRRNVELLQAR